MARAKRWTIPFVSKNGKSCRVDIYEESWTGSVTELSTQNANAPGVPAENPFYYEETDDDDLLNVIRFRTGYINLIELEYNSLLDMYPETDTEHYVEFYYDGTLDFTGYIQAQAFKNDWVAMPRRVSLPIISPLGLLEGMDFAVVATPTEMSRDTIMSEVITGLNAAYLGYMMPDNLNNFRLRSQLLCPPNDNPGELDGSDAYKPISYKDFIEGFCHVFGLIAHDTPEYIVFSQFDSDESYTNSGGTGSFSRDLDDYFSIADDNHKESTVRPLKEIVINYEGSLDFEAQINMNGTVFMKQTQTTSSRAAFMQVVNKEIVSNLFLTEQMSGIGSGEVPTNNGVMVGCFGGQTSQVDGVLIYYDSAWTPVSTKKIVEFRFYNYPVVKTGDTCVLNMSFLRASTIYQLPGSENTDPLYFSVDVDGDYYNISDYSWDNDQIVIQGSQLNNGFYMRNVPKGNCLTVAVYGTGLSDNDLVLITSVRLAAGALERWMYKYETAKEKTVKGDSKSTETASFNLLFSFDKLNSNSVIDAEYLSFTPPEYPYMFLAQNRLDLTMERTADFPIPYIGKWKYFVDSWRWRMVGLSFWPRDDKYSLTLMHSTVIDPAATYTVSGVVTDGTNVLSGVVVTLGGQTVTTGADGAYSFSGVSAGSYTLGATLDGCTFDSISISVNADTTQNIVMTRIYDAQVEYLESTGTQYIMTTIYPTADYTFDTKVAATSSAYNCVFWGCRSSGTYNTANYQCYLNSNTQGSADYEVRKIKLYSTTTSLSTNWDSGIVPTVGVMNELTDITVVSTMNTATYPMAMFGFNVKGSITKMSCRIGGLTVYDNGTKIADFIPVRVGTVGYMYDKVSGELFGNSGTGAFTYGADV